MKESPGSDVQVSVVVVNYNGEHLLRGCLDSIIRQDCESVETIVVDNGSSDGSRELVRSEYPSVRVLEMPTNVGYARGANQGILYGSGKVCALIDTDASLAPNWLRVVLEVVRLHHAAIVGGKVYFSRKRNLLYSAGGLVNRKNGLVMMRGYGQADVGRFDREEEVDWVTGCSFAFQRDLTRKIGFLDAGYETYREDVDFCLRAKKAGFKVMYVPEAVSWHAVSATSERWGRKHYLLYRNWIRFNLINLNALYLVPGILYSLVNSSLVFLRCVIRSEKSRALETIRAVGWNLPRIADSLLLRRTLIRQG